MNCKKLSRIVDAVRIIDALYCIRELRFCIEHAISDARSKYFCKHYKGGTAPKMGYDTLEEVDKFVEWSKPKVESGEWPRTTAAYWCPSCCAWHTTTSTFDPKYTQQWIEKEIKTLESVGTVLHNKPKDGIYYKIYSTESNKKYPKKPFNRREAISRQKMKEEKELMDLIRQRNPGRVTNQEIDR